MTEQVTEQAVEQAGPTLTLQDLTLTANIMDLAVQRGAFKAAEAETVGQQFNKLVAIIQAIAPPAEAAEEGSEEAEGEAEA